MHWNMRVTFARQYSTPTRTREPRRQVPARRTSPAVTSAPLSPWPFYSRRPGRWAHRQADCRQSDGGKTSGEHQPPPPPTPHPPIHTHASPHHNISIAHPATCWHRNESHHWGEHDALNVLLSCPTGSVLCVFLPFPHRDLFWYEHMRHSTKSLNQTSIFPTYN